MLHKMNEHFEEIYANKYWRLVPTNEGKEKIMVNYGVKSKT